VIEGLSVTRPDRQAKVIQISYRTRSAAEAVRLVKAVVESYEAFLEDVYARDNSQVVVPMSKARDDLNGELKDLERRYLEFRQRTQHLAPGGNGRTFLAQRLDEWDRVSRDAMVRAVQLKAQLELGRQLARSGVGLWSIAYAMDQLGGTGPGAGGGQGLAARAQAFGPSPPNDYVRQLAAEQQRLADTLGPQSTKVKEIQEQITEAQAHARRARGAAEQAEIDDLLASVGKGLAAIEGMRGEVQKQFEGDLAQAKKDEIDQLAEATLKSELERHRTLFNTVVDQLKQAELVGDFAGTRAHVIERPNADAYPVRPLRSITLALAVATGLFVGVASALASELVAPRVRSAAETGRALSLPVLGQVPFVPESQAPREPGGSVGLICQAMSRSPSAEAYRVIRANLDLARRGRDVRVVLVTGPRAGDGCSAVASNLAVSLAQAGRRVALVDADLRDPTLHRTFGLPRDRGLVHLLRDLLPPSRVAQPTRVTYLDLIASGPDVPNPAELLSSPEVAGALARLREGYDTVVVNAPPLLDFADAAVLGALADAVVLIVRLTVTRRSDAARAVETLKGLGTPILGVVINGAAPVVPPPWVRVPAGWRVADPGPGTEPGTDAAGDGGEALTGGNGPPPGARGPGVRNGLGPNPGQITAAPAGLSYDPQMTFTPSTGGPNWSLHPGDRRDVPGEGGRR
jgi:capsular exopolysaccharide synthesis family protein